MDPVQENILAEARACDARKVEQARRMEVSEKLRAGAELFDHACEWTLAGIRMQHPDWNQAECMSELKRRLALG